MDLAEDRIDEPAIGSDTESDAAAAAGEDTANLIDRAHRIQTHIAGASPVLAPSKLWKTLARNHEGLLHTLGIERFKRGLSQSYSTFAIRRLTHPNYRAVLRAFLRRPRRLPFSARMAPGHVVNAFGEARLAGRLRQHVYASYVGLLWAMIDDGTDDLPARLAEPSVGDPLPVMVGGKPVSQDLATSIHEIRAMRPHLSRHGVLAEVGAGYGRLGQVARESGLRYWVFDIAPALTVSEWYLGQVFPDARHFRWRPFASWEEVVQEAESADFAFFSADQIGLLPPGRIDVFAAISCLHEMTDAQCAYFLEQMGEKARTAIYTRNWTEMRNHQDRLTFRAADLAPPPGWRVGTTRRDRLWPRFTEQLFVRDS